ncbi:hypothetical protein CRE_07214 [Caenorhabditis remanei]|uniref:Uncharacterized protein n=1 Tax=Caenorhabditis remanei TaxID=31234 RepID=E3M2V2_CAERE|nr:hypothetical protein CRE_07214 [Caenorhabditis remanei]
MEPSKEKSAFRPLKRKLCVNDLKTQDDYPERVPTPITDLPINAHPSPISPQLIRKHEEMYHTIATQEETIKVLTDQRNREIALLSRVVSEHDKKMNKTIKEAETNVTNKLEKTVEESSSNIRDSILVSNRTLFGFHCSTISNFGIIHNQVASVEKSLQSIKNNQQQFETSVDVCNKKTKESLEEIIMKHMNLQTVYEERLLEKDAIIASFQQQIEKSLIQAQELKSVYERNLIEKDKEIAVLKHRQEREQETFKTEIEHQKSINFSISKDSNAKQNEIGNLKKVIERARTLLGPRANLLGKNHAD